MSNKYNLKLNGHDVRGKIDAEIMNANGARKIISDNIGISGDRKLDKEEVDENGVDNGDIIIPSFPKIGQEDKAMNREGDSRECYTNNNDSDNRC
ncbi:hypothetical protein AMTR_s00053p00176000 [Amborella trichopoda]|uniref:Uncharacterized protein n=1 Tax=Amborella trichopoda TaxID=13333 RepID=W1PDI6_AMBTC|nr:hypothetical protein AMTR_s00053p00176000 [Amborella trichopoda]